MAFSCVCVVSVAATAARATLEPESVTCSYVVVVVVVAGAVLVGSSELRGGGAASSVVWSISGSMSGCDEFGRDDSIAFCSTGDASFDISFRTPLLHHVLSWNGRCCNDRSVGE